MATCRIGATGLYPCAEQGTGLEGALAGQPLRTGQSESKAGQGKERRGGLGEEEGYISNGHETVSGLDFEGQ